MGLFAPWADSCIHNQIEEQYSVMFIYQLLLSTLCNNKANSNSYELEDLGMYELKPINILMKKSKISSNTLKIYKGLTQWALVPL